VVVVGVAVVGGATVVVGAAVLVRQRLHPNASTRRSNEASSNSAVGRDSTITPTLKTA